MDEAERYFLPRRKGARRRVNGSKIVCGYKGAYIGEADHACLSFLEEVVTAGFFGEVEEIVKDMDNRD